MIVVLLSFLCIGFVFVFNEFKSDTQLHLLKGISMRERYPSAARNPFHFSNAIFCHAIGQSANSQIQCIPERSSLENGGK